MIKRVELARRIDEQATGERYARWFRGLRGIGTRYLFSRSGLWVLNTPYRRILGAARITPQDRVLDLGCGLASILIALAERIPFSVPPVGVDVSPEIVTLARKHVQRAGLDGRIEILAGAATNLPFPLGRFDVVLSSHVIKHLDDATLVLALSEVARVLSPGGRFVFWEFARSPWSAPVFWSACATGLPPPFCLRSEKELSEALSRAGFVGVERAPCGLFLIPPLPRLALLARKP